MKNLTGKIEAILFAVAKPLSISQLSKALEIKNEDVVVGIEELKNKLNTEDSGVQLIDHAGKLSLVTNPNFADEISKFAKEDLAGELTRPSLETLTIVAYRGPITKPEIEQIRGVNCSLIIRNLLMRDMIVEEMDKEKLQPVYQVSETFLRHVGVKTVSDLPSYEDFANNEDIDSVLKEIGISQ